MRPLATLLVCALVTAACSGSARQEADAPATSSSPTSSPTAGSATPGSPTPPDPATPDPATPDPATPDPTTAAHPSLQHALEGTPRRPASPREAAEMVNAAQRVIRSDSPEPAVLEAAGHTAQLAIREISVRERWLPRVLTRLGPRNRAWVRANVASRREFRSMHPSSNDDLADTLPAWRIVRPEPVHRLLRHYREAQRRYGIDWEYLAAIHLVETAFGRIRGTSVAGAQGPMQFIPTTWDIYGEGGDINNTRDAILAAGRLLRANGFARDKGSALWRYNNSWAYVRGVTHHARAMERDPAQLHGFHAWQVYYLTRHGSVWLPPGYERQRPIPVRRYVAAHPAHLP